MKLRTEEEAKGIVKEVRNRLAARKDLPLKVSEDGYRLEDEWVYVVVSPEREDIRAYDHVQALAAIEKELRETGYPNVLLVPALDD